MEEKKIKPGILILHFFLLLTFFVVPAMVMYSVEGSLTPLWAESLGETDLGEELMWLSISSVMSYIFLYLFSIPLFFLWALWLKSIYNHTIPIIYNIRNITYWESFGLSVLITFLVFVLGIKTF